MNGGLGASGRRAVADTLDTLRALAAPPGAPRYGIVDTTFSRVDMGSVAEAALRSCGVPDERIMRRTVPGFKDLGVAAKRLIEREGCSVVVACGMVGPEPVDKQCAQDASLGIQMAQLMTSTHVLEVFVHMDEADTDPELVQVCRNRAEEHAVNAYWLVEAPEELRRRAGTGQRQGFPDVGPVAETGNPSAGAPPHPAMDRAGEAPEAPQAAEGRTPDRSGTH